MKTIAIDLNDVIRETTAKFLEVYKRDRDITCTLELDDIKDFDFLKQFNFKDYDDYAQFRWETYAATIYGGAEIVDKKLSMSIRYWVNNVLGNLDEENVPNVMIFSPFETGGSIMASLSFLRYNYFQLREYYFPVDSMTIFDRADIVITANPNLIKNCPEGKTCVKINMPYNQDVECNLTYNSLKEFMDDEETIEDILK